MRGLTGLALLVLLALPAGLAWRIAARPEAPTTLRFSAGSPTGEYYDFASALRDLVACGRRRSRSSWSKATGRRPMRPRWRQVRRSSGWCSPTR